MSRDTGTHAVLSDFLGTHTVIVVDDVRKSFGNVKAVRGVSFRAEDGKITGLLGPNGAGKSTTLRILYTLLKPDSGTASVNQHDVLNSPVAARSTMGVLPDPAGIYPRLTARENIAYYGRLQGLDGDRLDKQVESVIELLDLSDFADRRTKGFSHGQRSKVALARALVHEPHNVLLDEPSTGLDVMATRALRNVIRQLRDQRKCVLFSSHVMQEVAALCDAIVIIDKGKVVATGTPDEIRAHTNKDNLEDAFVAAIGSAEGLE